MQLRLRKKYSNNACRKKELEGIRKELEGITSVDADAASEKKYSNNACRKKELEGIRKELEGITSVTLTIRLQ